MKRYGNARSGIVAYELHDDAIHVKFRSGEIYVYDVRRPGPEHVAAMKQLAVAGEGLATYISQHVRDAYAGKR